VLVSHDRHLIGLVCETFWRVADGKVESFNSDLDEYAAWLRSRNNEPRPAKAAAKVAPAPAPKPVRSRHESDLAAKRLTQVEARIALLQDELSRIETQLADPAIYGNDGGIEIGQLAQRQGELAKEKDGLESEWLELAD